MNKLSIYIITINILSFILIGWDKHCAIKNKWRIKESTLLSISLLGGCFGTIIGMFLFHHKTKKLKFKILVPMLIILYIFLLIHLYN